MAASVTWTFNKRTEWREKPGSLSDDVAPRTSFIPSSSLADNRKKHPLQMSHSSGQDATACIVLLRAPAVVLMLQGQSTLLISDCSCYDGRRPSGLRNLGELLIIVRLYKTIISRVGWHGVRPQDRIEPEPKISINLDKAWSSTMFR